MLLWNVFRVNFSYGASNISWVQYMTNIDVYTKTPHILETIRSDGGVSNSQVTAAEVEKL